MWKRKPCRKNRRREEGQVNGRAKNLTGLRFGRLTVVRLTDERQYGRTVWECKCDCGRVVFVDQWNLKRGTTKSCGWLRKENSGRNRKKVGGETAEGKKEE